MYAKVMEALLKLLLENHYREHGVLLNLCSLRNNFNKTFAQIIMAIFSLLKFNL